MPPALPAPQHFTAPIPATPSDFRAAFSFVYEPQLSAERAAAAAAEAGGAAAPAPPAAAGRDVARDDSANPAKALDGLLLGLLGGLRGSGGSSAQQQPVVRGVAYPEADIAALNAAKRFLVKVRLGPLAAACMAVVCFAWWRLPRVAAHCGSCRLCWWSSEVCKPGFAHCCRSPAAALPGAQAGVVNK